MAKTKKAETNADLKSALNQLEDTLEVYLVDKAPSIPDNIKELIVKFGPWLTLIVLVMSLPAILFALGVGTLLTPFSFFGGIGTGVGFTFSIIFTAAMLVVEAIAIPGLFKRKMSAWKLLFYVSLIGAAQNLFSFNLGGLVIGTLLSWYILFQIKSYYK